jgi:alpha-tubulin suppressor-like RCC1 family protein
VIQTGARAAAAGRPATLMAVVVALALALTAGAVLLACDSRVEGTVLSSTGDDPDGGANACFTAVAAGAAATCVIRTGGELVCFGSNELGQLGAATTATAGEAVRVDLGGPVVQVAAGDGYACARRNDDTLWCWGLTAGAAGQLGNGSADGSPTPIQVEALGTDVIDVVAGASATCALTRDQSVWCWGDNSEGAVGVGAVGGITAPTQVTGFGAAEEVCTAGAHSCARTGEGIIWCWGRNVDGETGTEAASAQPVAAPAVVRGSTRNMPAAGMTCGAHHTCAALRGGSLWCWGSNDAGQLGLGASAPSADRPALVLDLGTSSVQVTAGAAHSCVRVRSGGVACFGSNEQGAMGYEASATPSYSLAPIIGLPNGIARVSAGALHNCILATDGNVWCWGDNRHGETMGGTQLTVEVTPFRIDCALGTTPPT